MLGKQVYYAVNILNIRNNIELLEKLMDPHWTQNYLDDTVLDQSNYGT